METFNIVVCLGLSVGVYAFLMVVEKTELNFWQDFFKKYPALISLIRLGQMSLWKSLLGGTILVPLLAVVLKLLYVPSLLNDLLIMTLWFGWIESQTLGDRAYKVAFKLREACYDKIYRDKGKKTEIRHQTFVEVNWEVDETALGPLEQEALRYYGEQDLSRRFFSKHFQREMSVAKFYILAADQLGVCSQKLGVNGPLLCCSQRDRAFFLCIRHVEHSSLFVLSKISHRLRVAVDNGDVEALEALMVEARELDAIEPEEKKKVGRAANP